MADKARSRGVSSRNLPTDIKAKWQVIGKYCQTQFNIIQKEQGLEAGIAYINSIYDAKYPSGANAPTDTMHHVDSGANTPPISMDFTEADGKKKISALLSDTLHKRLSIHSAITGNSFNQILSNLIHTYIPDYQVTVK